MNHVFNIEQNKLWFGKLSLLRQLKPLTLADWGKMLELAELYPDGVKEEKVAEIENLQLEALRYKVSTAKRPSPEIIAAWKAVNFAEAEEYELGLLQVSVAKSTADRVAAHVSKRSDIGQLPPWDDEKIKQEIMADPVAACWKYFPGWFYRPPSKLTRTIIEVIWQIILHGGNQGIGVIRGGGKSTITKALVTLAGLIGLLKYVIVFAANDKKARSIKKDIVKQLETNDLLCRDFPAACIPIRCLEGKPQRAAGQTYNGERTHIQYGTEFTQLATIPGANSSCFKLQCLGVEGGFLGQLSDGVRPDFVLGDDIQNLKLAKSDTYVADLEDTIRQGFEGLGGKDSPLRILLLLTCTREGDFPDRVLNPDLYPEYSGLRFGLVENWGTAEELWEEYLAIYKDDLRNGDKRFQAATKFYLDHRAAMDDGVIVTDPEFFVHDLEVSAIQGAWNARARMGDKGYFAQMENRPISMESSLYTLQAGDVARILNGMKRRQLPGWAHAVFAFADCGADKLRWSVIAFGQAGKSATLDYGVWPPRGRVAPLKSTGKALERCVWQAMDGLRVYLAQAVFERHGEPQRIIAMGYDRGWEAATVQSYCKAFSGSNKFPIVAMRGQGMGQWRPGSRKAIKHGWNTQLVQTIEGAAPGEFINVHTDFWKEYVQRSFLVDNFSEDGACSFWGTDARSHGEVADHICSEVLVDKGRGTNGTEFWKWALKPGCKNHFLDTFVGCFALAGFYGYLRRTEKTDISDQPQEIRSKVRSRMARKRRKCKVQMEEY